MGKYAIFGLCYVGSPFDKSALRIQGIGARVLVLITACAGLALVPGLPLFSASWGLRRTEGSDQTPVESTVNSIWDWRTWRSDQTEVIVVVVGSAKKVAQVRAAVRDGEVVAEISGAFALRRRHVVAASYEEVGPLLAKAGWREAPISLWAPTRETQPPAAASSSDADLGDLATQPSLSELDLVRLLDVIE